MATEGPDILFILSIITTWAMYSQLTGKPNPFYSLAQATYVGLALALNFTVSFWFIWNNGIVPITQGRWFMGIGIILGAIMVLRVSKKYRPYSRIPLAIAIGTGLALSLRTQVFTGFVDQVRSLMYPLFIAGDLKTSLYNTTLTVNTILMLTFFLYTFEQKGALRTSARLGEYSLYIGLGAYFAQVFMGRLGLLVGYMQEITDPSWKVPYSLGIGVLMLAVILGLDRYKILEKVEN